MAENQRWEYFTFKIDEPSISFSEVVFNQRLNELGVEGWELVSVLYISSAFYSDVRCIVAVLKRPQPR